MTDEVGGERPEVHSRFAFLGSSSFLFRMLILLCAVAISIPVLYKGRPGRDHSIPAAFSIMSSTQKYVRISGAVRHPGIYAAPVNAMTITAIKMADPVSPVVQGVSGIDAAEIVSNGMALHLAVRTDGALLVTKSSMTTSERLVMGISLDINTMSEADFDRVPGIGPLMAKRIVLYRQKNGGLMAVSDLQLIEGIGKKKYKHLALFF